MADRFDFGTLYERAWIFGLVDNLCIWLGGIDPLFLFLGFSLALCSQPTLIPK